MSSIKLSPKHGVNPSLSACFYCGKDKNEILLLGRLPDDAEAPHRLVYSMEPCEECKDYMEKGIICISIDPKLSKDTNNPWRTGRWAVVTDNGVKRFGMPPELLEKVLEKRVCFMEEEVWDRLGIPVGEVSKREEGEPSDG